MKTLARRLTPLLLLMLAACSALFGAHEVELPLPRLQQELERHFPHEDRYLALFDVTLSQPRLTLQPDAGRVELQLATRIAPVLGGAPTDGSLTVSGALRIDAASHALLLERPRVERFTLDGVEDGAALRIGQIGGLLLQQVLSELPLHRFEPGDFRRFGVEFAPASISVKSDALAVTFEPVK